MEVAGASRTCPAQVRDLTTISLDKGILEVTSSHPVAARNGPEHEFSEIPNGELCLCMEVLTQDGPMPVRCLKHRIATCEVMQVQFAPAHSTVGEGVTSRVWSALGTERRILVSGSWALGPGPWPWVLGPGSWVLGSGPWPLECGP